MKRGTVAYHICPYVAGLLLLVDSRDRLGPQLFRIYCDEPRILKRNLYFCLQDVKEAAYKTMVRPILEYGSSVWDPYTGPGSANGRASASGAGGRGFDPGPRHTKGVKMVPVATLLGAQHYKASTGSSLTHY